MRCSVTYWYSVRLSLLVRFELRLHRTVIDVGRNKNTGYEDQTPLYSMFDQVAGGAFRHTTGNTLWRDGKKYLSRSEVVFFCVR